LSISQKWSVKGLGNFSTKSETLMGEMLDGLRGNGHAVPAAPQFLTEAAANR
jgi:hypothetical protein